MKKDDPESWEEAKRMDKMLRHGVKGANEALYLHPTMNPLEEVDYPPTSTRDKDFYGTTGAENAKVIVEPDKMANRLAVEPPPMETPSLRLVDIRSPQPEPASLRHMPGLEMKQC